jgi:hypothetical protein
MCYLWSRLNQWLRQPTQSSADEHKVDKDDTQNIECKKLDLRTRIKRLQRQTIGFSKSEEIHDKLIGFFHKSVYVLISIPCRHDQGKFLLILLPNGISLIARPQMPIK